MFSTLRIGFFPQVGFDDFFVIGNLFGGAFSNSLTIVDGVDAIGDGHDDLHNVLDNNDGHTAVANFLDQFYLYSLSGNYQIKL